MCIIISFPYTTLYYFTVDTNFSQHGSVVLGMLKSLKFCTRLKFLGNIKQIVLKPLSLCKSSTKTKVDVSMLALALGSKAYFVDKLESRLQGPQEELERITGENWHTLLVLPRPQLDFG